MKTHRSIFRLVCLFALVASASAADLTGKWRGVVPTADNIEFTAQGLIVVEKNGATMSGKFKALDAERIQIEFSGFAALAGAQIFRYQLRGDSLTITDSRGTPDNYVRSGSLSTGTTSRPDARPTTAPLGTAVSAPSSVTAAKARFSGKWIVDVFSTQEAKPTQTIWDFRPDGLIYSGTEEAEKTLLEYEFLSPARVLFQGAGGTSILSITYTETGIVLENRSAATRWHLRRGNEAEFKNVGGLLSKEAQGKAIMNNLRQLSFAADMFYLTNSASKAQLSQLVGPDKEVKRLIPVAGEDYFALKFQQGVGLSVTTADGRVFTYAP